MKNMFLQNSKVSIQRQLQGVKKFPDCQVTFRLSRLLHSCERKTSVTTVTYTYYPSVVFASANCYRLSNLWALHSHCGRILQTVDTSVAVPAQVINYYAFSQVNVSIRVANTRCNGRTPVTRPTAARAQAVTLLSTNFYTVGNT